jgi:hypothetical protein
MTAASPNSNRVMINRMRMLGLKAHQIGICYGLSAVGVQAILARKVADFDERYNTMIRIPEADFVESVENVKLKNQNRETLTPEEKRILEIPPFFEGIDINFGSHLNYQYLFTSENKPVTQNIMLTSSHTLSPTLEAKGGLVNVAAFAGRYFQEPEYTTDRDISTNEITRYFKSFRQSLEKGNFKNPVTFLLGSKSHAITVGYDPKLKQWFCINADRMPTKIFPQNMENELANELADSFSKAQYNSFTTHMYSTAEDSHDLKKIVRDWQNTKEYQEIHEVKGEKLSDTSWMALAARAGDAISIRKLLNKKIDYHQKDNDGDSPILVAARGNHLAVLDEFAKNNADMHVENAYGINALWAASSKGHDRIIRKLMSYHFDINKKKSRRLLTSRYCSS